MPNLKWHRCAFHIFSQAAKHVLVAVSQGHPLPTFNVKMHEFDDIVLMIATKAFSAITILSYCGTVVNQALSGMHFKAVTHVAHVWWCAVSVPNSDEPPGED